MSESIQTQILNKAKTLVALIKYSKNTNMKNHHDLVGLENYLASKYYFNILPKAFADDISTVNYLRFTSIPFVAEDSLHISSLKKLWNVECDKCSSVLPFKVFPTGNLSPQYIIVGEAPSATGKYSVYGNSFARVWVHGSTSNILREALCLLDIHNFAWYTNILKCPVPSNRGLLVEEVKNCYKYMEKELSILNPSKAIILGMSAQKAWKMWNFDIESCYVNHPAYFVYRRVDCKVYAEHIAGRLIGQKVWKEKMNGEVYRN